MASETLRLKAVWFAAGCCSEYLSSSSQLSLPAVRRCMSLIVMIILAGCSESTWVEPVAYLEGQFPPSKSEKLILYLTNLGNKKGFEVREQDRAQMARLSDGKKAFHLSFFSVDGDGPLVFVTNVGAGEKLTLGAYSSPDFPREEALQTANNIVEYLASEMDVRMVPVDPVVQDD